MKRKLFTLPAKTKTQQPVVVNADDVVFNYAGKDAAQVPAVPQRAHFCSVLLSANVRTVNRADFIRV